MDVILPAMFSSPLASIQRSLYKFIYKLMVGSDLKHNRRFWPYYQIERGTNNELLKIRFKHQLIVDNTTALPISKRPAMLIATGPSVHELNPALLTSSQFDYIGMNGAIALSQINYRYYVIIDHNFVMNRFDLVQLVIERDLILFTTPRCLDLILRKTSPANIRAQIKAIEPISHGIMEPIMQRAKPVNQNNHVFEDCAIYNNNYGFSLNIWRGVFDYFTVAYVALQVIYALKYQRIYIAGLDMNNLSKPRFYETNENKQPTWLDLHLDKVIPAFDTAAQAFKAQHIDVINLSLNSSVTAFKKKDSHQINS